MSLEEVKKAIKATVEKFSTEEFITGVSTDSKKISPGDLFFAIEGPKFDGHDFVCEALEAGAAGAVISREIPDKACGRNKVIFEVKDTVTALGDLARHYRRGLATTVIAITGSNGKTTTKEMVYHLLKDEKVAVKAEKSFNNYIGVPLTIFRIEPSHDYAVIEMGVNRPGEIGRLADIASADIGIITNISETHLEGLVNVLGVALEKAQLLDCLGEKGTGILNKDDPWCQKVAARCAGKIIWFGLAGEADVFATRIRQKKNSLTFMLNDNFEIEVPVIGRYNVYNALAAIAVAKREGLQQEEIAKRLKTFTPPEMRMQRLSFKGAQIINDAYNANPKNMECALWELSQMKAAGRKIFVCGDMLELGQFSRDLHRQLGQRIAGAGVEVLFTVGTESKEAALSANKSGISFSNIFSFENSKEAAEKLRSFLREGDLVLLKGSRMMRLEEIVKDLTVRKSRKKK